MADIAVFVKPVPVTVNGVPEQPLEALKEVIDKSATHSTFTSNPATVVPVEEKNLTVTYPPASVEVNALTGVCAAPGNVAVLVYAFAFTNSLPTTTPLAL